ncbi:MAG TPA: enoyl-CoA hydratase-related protein [Thermoanaerobaculia bacterium]
MIAFPGASIFRAPRLPRQPHGIMPQNYANILVEKSEGIAVVTVNRPDKLNALNAATVGELERAFRDVAADDDVRGVIVTGAGEKAFVAGADIGELAQMGPIDGVAVSRLGQDAFRFLETMGKPVIAAVNGFALGGGMELALACHLRVASEKAKFGLPEVKLGIIPGYGGTVRLPRIVGRGRALELILTGEMIDAAEAHRIGLANRVVAPGTTLDEARALMTKVLGNGPVALRLALESVDHGADASMDEGLTLESSLFGLLATTDDMREGMAAFLEKRAAAFTGR